MKESTGVRPFVGREGFVGQAGRLMYGTVFLAVMLLGGPVRAEDTKSAEEYVREAMRSIDKKNFNDALTQLDDAIDQNDRLAAAYFHRGMLLLQMQDEKGAVSNFDKAMALRPDYSPVYLGKGVIEFRQGRLDRAEEFLSRAIKLDPSFGMAFYNRGVVFYQQGKLSEAEKDLRRALELGTEVDPDLFEEVWTLNHLDEVIADTNQKIQEDPHDAEAYYNRGIAYYYKKDFFHARRDLEKAKTLGIDVEEDLMREVAAPGLG